MAFALGTVDFGVTSVAVGAHQSVGVYFGSFDPPHENHVALARHAVRHCGLGCVVFVASPCLLTKPTLSPLDARVAMLQARLWDEPNMAVYLHGAAPLDLSLKNVANRDAVCAHVDNLCRRATPSASARALMSKCDESASVSACAHSASGGAEPTRGDAAALDDGDGGCAHQVTFATTSSSVISNASESLDAGEHVSAHDSRTQHNSSNVRSKTITNHTASFGDDKTTAAHSHLMYDKQHHHIHHVRHEAPTLSGRSGESSRSCASVELGPNDTTTKPPVFQLIGGDKVGAWARSHLGLDRDGHGVPSRQEQGSCLALVFPRDGCDDKTRSHQVASDRHHQTTTKTTTHHRMHVVADYKDPHVKLSSTSVRRAIGDLSGGSNASSTASPSSKPSTTSELNDLAQRCGVHPAVFEIALAHGLYSEAVSDAFCSHRRCVVS